jgi:hypothetical protein
MQKPLLKFFFVVFLWGILLFVVPNATASQSTFTLNFSESDLSFEKLEGFDKVKLLGCRLQGSPGDPMLPAKYVQIAIPLDMEVVSVQVNSLKRVPLSRSYNIFPAQKLRPLMDIPWENEDYQLTPPNSGTYSLSQEFPGKVVEVLSHGFLAGQHIAGLIVYPLQYIPSEGKLILCTRLEFTLIFGPAKTHPVPVLTRTEKQADFYQKTVEGFVLNPQDVAYEKQGGSKQETVEYLLITDTNYVSTFQQLADWKTKKGVPAEIVTRQWIYSHYSGDDQQCQIRNCIKDFYQNRGTIWVLLGGDTDILPHRITWVFESGVGYYWWEDDIPSDLYFSDLEGSWDADEDSTYGEFEDDLDLYPDVMVGRAPVSSLSQAQAFVSKTLAYESDPPTDYQTKMLLAAEYLWPDTDGGVLKNYIYDTYVTPLFPDVTKLYESLSNLTKNNFRDALNSGQMITNHDGHANYNVLSIGSYGWYNSDMDALNNGSLQGIFYTSGCISAAIDFDCIAEHFVKNPNGGGIGYFGNTRYGWASYDPLEGPGAEFDKGFFHQLCDFHSYHAGKTLADSKIPFIPSAQSPYGDGPYNRWTMLELVLLGDPEMPIYTEPLQTLTVSYPETTAVGYQTIDVYVEKEGAPVNGALVCLSKAGEVYEYNVTAANGSVSFDIEPLTPGEISVTVTCQNAVPHQGSITIPLAGPYPPLPFSLIFPLNGDTVWSTQPLLIWERSEDIDSGDVVIYDLHYSYFIIGQGLVQDSVIDLSDTTYILSGLNDDQLYFWKVKAKDSHDLFRWSNQESSFRTYLPEPPQSFSLISPPDEDTVWESACDLAWHKSQDPDPGDVITYVLFYSTDSLFVQKDSILGILDTNHTAPGLSDDQNYFWKVKAKDRFDLSIWSTEVLRFHTYYPEPPSPFGLFYPPDSASIYNQDTLTLMWESAQDPDPEDAVRYILEYGTSIAFNPDSTVFVDSIAENSYPLDGLSIGEPYKHYYWRVKAFDKFGLITSSDQIFNFEVSAYLAGDASGDQMVDLADVVFLVNYLYRSGDPPSPLVAGDANCDEEIDLGDVVYLINYLYKSGPDPCYP